MRGERLSRAPSKTRFALTQKATGSVCPASPSLSAVTHLRSVETLQRRLLSALARLSLFGASIRFELRQTLKETEEEERGDLDRGLLVGEDILLERGTRQAVHPPPREETEDSNNVCVFFSLAEHSESADCLLRPERSVSIEEESLWRRRQIGAR